MDKNSVNYMGNFRYYITRKFIAFLEVTKYFLVREVQEIEMGWTCS
jgi:hypothetical protein